MADDRDDAWLRALAGRPDAELPAELRREAEALRRALGRERDAPPAAPDERELERLLFRLRRERLLEPGSRWTSRTWVPLAAAAVLVLAVAPTLLSPDFRRPDEDVAIGSRLDIQIVETADVERSLGEIAAALRAAGIEPEATPSGRHRGISASIPADRIDAVRPALEQLGVKVPADGELRVEMRGK